MDTCIKECEHHSIPFNRGRVVLFRPRGDFGPPLHSEGITIRMYIPAKNNCCKVDYTGLLQIYCILYDLCGTVKYAF